MQKPVFYETSAAGRILELCSERVRQLARAKKIPSIRTANGRLLFRREDLDAFARERRARQVQNDAA